MDHERVVKAGLELTLAQTPPIYCGLPHHTPTPQLHTRTQSGLRLYTVNLSVQPWFFPPLAEALPGLT